MVSLVNKVGELSNAATLGIVKGARNLANITGVRDVAASAKDIYQGAYAKGAHKLGEGLLRLTATVGVIVAVGLLFEKALDSKDYCIEIRSDNTTAYRYFGEPCDKDSRIRTFCQKLFSSDMYSSEELPRNKEETNCFEQLKEFKSPEPEDFYSEKILSKISPLTAPQLTVSANLIKDYCQPRPNKLEEHYKEPLALSDVRRCISLLLGYRVLLYKLLEKS